MNVSGSRLHVSPPQGLCLADCDFHHSMSIPGVGEIVGLWDLRETIDDYLGRIDFAGKRVLCAKRCRSILITELYYPEMTGAICELIPTRENEVWHTWWRFGPDFFTRYLGVLGFADTKISYHEHRHTLAPERMFPMFSVVGSRT